MRIVVTDQGEDGRVFDVRVRNGGGWFYLGIACLVIALVGVFTPEERLELMMFGLTMSAFSFFMWWSERRQSSPITIGVGPSLIWTDHTNSHHGSSREIVLESGQAITVEKRVQQERRREGRRQVSVVYDVVTGDETLVRGIQFRRNAEKLSDRLTNAVAEVA
jgi:hypothetical protein